MEHEVFVPVEAQSLRQTLRDPARVARCVPGLQQDAGEPPIAGRLKVRLGGSTITYRGALRITEQNGGVFAFEGEGVEVRGAGAAKLTLTVRLEPAPGGTTLAFAGTALAEGRATDVPADAAQASALRLLDRFAAELARPVREEPGRAAGGAAEVADTDLNTDLADGPKDRAAPSTPSSTRTSTPTWTQRASPPSSTPRCRRRPWTRSPTRSSPSRSASRCPPRPRTPAAP